MDKRLENRIKEADDKLSVFANKDELNQYDFKMFEILELIKDYLTDEEKAKLFDFSHFQTLATSTKLKIIEMIRDSNLKLQLLSRDEVTNDIPYELISKFDDDTIKKVLYNEKLLSKCDFYNFEVKELIESRGEKLQFEILTNTKLMKEKLDMSEKDISKMAQKLPSDEEKIKIMEIYQFENEIAINIIGTFNSNTRKVDIVLEENRFEKNDKIAILNTLDMESLIEFLRENKEFCRQNDIQPYEITFRLNQEQQKKL
ncbi:MAG: hypothetical protein HFJ48_02235 [Clostridia bacterium]|nr:hypothetical protein [Clostridia bacterium]